MSSTTPHDYDAAIAIIGMAGRFPDARDIVQFWRNMAAGVRSIRFFTDDELLAAGVDQALLQHPNFVKAGTVIEDVDRFDANFFGYPPREAEVMDPQHRLFLECSWEAIEHAAYSPLTFPGLIGVFAGSAFPDYMTQNIATNPELVESVGNLQIGLGNERDSLATAVSYKLNLRGPSLTIQTFCSTSLVAVHFASQSLLNYECDMALAGGVALALPQMSGYMYQEGGILSPDGYCRTFDANGQGSVMGNGVGVVVLKRMEEALDDGDQIYAVIRGSAVNNDGVQKVGFTAPGLAGQSTVIVHGMRNAGVKPETISYIEAHGTATKLGDSVELAALIKAFQRGTQKRQFCALGSAKPNIGHLDRAAGVTGLIKAALALHHKQLPPSIDFESPNPEIDLANSPFYVNTELRDWPANGAPRRAGVNAFGLGGTNAHVVLEEAPARPPAGPARPYQLLLLSAKSEAALETATSNLIAHCRANPDLNLADLAYTLQVGRAGFNYRRFLVCRELEPGLAALEGRNAQQVFTAQQTSRDRPVAFVFPGVGDHYAGMARELYQHEPAFRDTVDRCCEILKTYLGQDLRVLLYPPDALRPAAVDGAPASIDLRTLLGRNGAGRVEESPLQQTALAQPAVFVVEYALAHLLIQWGIKPQAFVGYSLGEYVAACLAGVLSLEDALRLVARRAQLIQALPQGAMLAVSCGEAQVRPFIQEPVCLAAVNSPNTCVLAGPPDAITAVARALEAHEIASRPLETSHAFHSTMLAPIAEAVTELAQSITLHPPSIPYLSNVTGAWITAEQATDPAYWAEHMCRTVRFADGVQVLLQQAQLVLLEVGPGQGLSSFVKQHLACGRERLALVLATLPGVREHQSDFAHLLGTLGKLWLLDVPIDWSSFYAGQRRYRLALPTYPFERQRFWIEPRRDTAPAPAPRPAGKHPDITDWFYVPVWEPVPLPATPQTPMPVHGCWLMFVDQGGLGATLAAALEERGAEVVRVEQGTRYAQVGPQQFQVRPHEPADYHSLLAALHAANRLPGAVLHLWSLDPLAAFGPEAFGLAQQRGFYSLLSLTQALAAPFVTGAVQLLVVTERMQAVTMEEQSQAEQATLTGLAKVIGQEHLTLSCRLIDLADSAQAEGLLAECTSAAGDPVVAYRDGARWVQGYAPLPLPAATPRLRRRGVYLITGGLGGVGLLLAEHLARTQQARLVLIGRSGLPERAEWPAWLATHEPGNPVSRRIDTVQALEALGGEVLVLAADTADAAQMQAALEQTRARFGELNGVLHAAGISDPQAFGLIQTLTVAQCEQHFQAKGYGLYVLEQVLEQHPLDFCMLFSSLSAVLGGLAFGGYAAANSFMDAFTVRHNRTHPVAWVSIDWDTWQLKTNQSNLFGATVAQYEMLPEEGVQTFERLISSSGQAQIVLSTGDLETRIRQWIRLESVRDAAEADDTPTSGPAPVLAIGEYEQRIGLIWRQVLGVTEVGLHDNFFDLGGNSLNSLQVIAKLKKEFKVQVPAVALFEAPTVSALAQYLRPEPSAQVDQEQARLLERRSRSRQSSGSGAVAIIGMVGRFPGAQSIAQFWQNLRDGVDAATSFSNEELLAAGIDPRLIQDPNYVKSRPILADVEHFDAAFFGYTPHEAEMMDPQQRLFHECAWEALETAGYDSQRYKGLIGVFAGANINLYLLRMMGDPEIAVTVNEGIVLENDKDALTTNVSYKLNLRGPSFAVQTFCSTSLVATHLACRSLLSGECDMALAGGVSVRVPVKAGYLFKPGDQVSSDGHCRTFDSCADGSTFGDGVAIVVLKRLEDALDDGDTIHAVIRGSAVNNDGGLKVGYTAPSVVGQSEVVLAALESAGLEPTTIGYIEAHGTATKLGDPIEVASLTKAYRTYTDKVGFCAISSVKPNVGHLDRAAGVTGLIKTVLSLQHNHIPATLHFRAPNPEIDFDSSPFFVPTTALTWPTNGGVRRAGVNSLGVGGTNAHVIVEQAPPLPPSSPPRPYHLLLLSAKTPAALEAATANLHAALAQDATLDLAEVAYTLQVGRRVFEQRRMLVCRDRDEALALLAEPSSRRVLSATQKPLSRTIAFMFPGVGDHYAGMAQELYQTEPVFRAAIDRCCRILTPLLEQDLRALLYPEAAGHPQQADSSQALDLRALLGRNGARRAGEQPLQQTALAQPAVFVVEYALAQLLIQWGIKPQAFVGYSLGEYVAACLAGVFSLEDALRLVARRAQLIQALPQGAMLAVSCGEEQVRPFIQEPVCLAAVNGPNTCVLAGPPDAIGEVARALEAHEIASRPLETSHAFHSTMLAPIAEAVTELAQSVRLHPPGIPYLSNVTGTWITAEQATDPAYWAEHMCRTVRFAEGVQALLQDEYVLLEVGPGQGLSSFARQHPACGRERLGLVLPTLPGLHERQSDRAHLLGTLGRLWLLDVPIDWSGFYADERRRRIALPTYPFERQRFWLEPRRLTGGTPDLWVRQSNITDWFAIPSWKRSSPLDAIGTESLLAERHNWLVLADGCGVGAQLASWLAERGQEVITVLPGAAFAARDSHSYSVRPTERADYTALLRELQGRQLLPQQVVHLWTVTPPLPDGGESEAELAQLLDQGFYSLLALTQALGDQGLESCHINIVSSDMQEVTGAEPLCPAKATVIGPCKVIPQEYANITSRSIDITLPTGNGSFNTALVELLAGELTSVSDDDIVALRGNHRWVQTYEPAPIPPAPELPRLRPQGVYLISGGLGGIGLAMAEHLATTVQARLVLLGRSALPPRQEWPSILEGADPAHGVARRIQIVQALEARGTEVLVVQADVSDPAQVRAALEQARAHFGAIHGVIHTAGVPGIGLMQLKSATAAAGVLAPKVQGTLALARALRGQPLDFLVLFSSITSATSGGPGQVDYCAANAFLDAYARRHCDEHGLTVAVGWGEWQWDAWSQGLQGFAEETRAFLIANRRAYGIGFEEGAEALRRVLSCKLPHVFVTTQNLSAMAAESKGTAAAMVFRKHRMQQESRPRYPRPTLGTSYIEPRNETEEKIAAIWCAALSIEQIGINDNFFDLGGNSLLGIDLVARIRRELKLEQLPTHILYEAPSVSALAEYIAQDQQGDEEDEYDEDRDERRREQLDFLQRRAEAEEVL